MGDSFLQKKGEEAKTLGGKALEVVVEHGLQVGGVGLGSVMAIGGGAVHGVAEGTLAMVGAGGWAGGAALAVGVVVEEIGQRIEGKFYEKGLKRCFAANSVRFASGAGGAVLVFLGTVAGVSTAIGVAAVSGGSVLIVMSALGILYSIYSYRKTASARKEVKDFVTNFLQKEIEPLNKKDEQFEEKKQALILGFQKEIMKISGLNNAFSPQNSAALLKKVFLKEAVAAYKSTLTKGQQVDPSEFENMFGLEFDALQQAELLVQGRQEMHEALTPSCTLL